MSINKILLKRHYRYRKNPFYVKEVDHISDIKTTMYTDAQRKIIWDFMKNFIFHGLKMYHLAYFIQEHKIQDNVIDNIIVYMKDFTKELYDYTGRTIQDFIDDYIEEDPLYANALSYYYIRSYLDMYNRYAFENILEYKKYANGEVKCTTGIGLLAIHIYEISRLDYKFMSHSYFSNAYIFLDIDRIRREMNQYVFDYAYKMLGDSMKKLYIADTLSKINFVRTLFFVPHILATSNNIVTVLKLKKYCQD